MLKLFKKNARKMMLIAGSALGSFGIGVSQEATAQAPYEDKRPKPTYLISFPKSKRMAPDSFDVKGNKIPADLPERSTMVRSEIGLEGYMIPYWGVYSGYLAGKTELIFGADNGRKNGIHFKMGTRYRAEYMGEPTRYFETWDTPTSKGFVYVSGQQSALSLGADGTIGVVGHLYTGHKKRLLNSLAVDFKAPLWRDGKSGSGFELTAASEINIHTITRGFSEQSEHDRKIPEKKNKAHLYIGVAAVLGAQKAQLYDAQGNPTGGFNDQPTLPYVQASIKTGFRF